MAELIDQVLDAWDKQAGILNNALDLLTPDLLEAKPSPDGMSVAVQLAHVHETRLYWLSKVSEPHAAGAGSLFTQDGEVWRATRDVNEIRTGLAASAKAVRAGLESALRTGSAGPYEHPMVFATHLIWHDGWHFGLIRLGLAQAGAEPTDEWEDANVWSVFRGPE
jgi:uncharacterized damage-inducible protein DinB